MEKKLKDESWEYQVGDLVRLTSWWSDGGLLITAIAYPQKNSRATVTSHGFVILNNTYITHEDIGMVLEKLGEPTEPFPMLVVFIKDKVHLILGHYLDLAHTTRKI